MKTDDLIAALATDLPAAQPRQIERRLALVLIPAGILVFAGLVWWLGMRDDLMIAMRGGAFWGKAAYTVLLSFIGFWLLSRTGRPGQSVRGPLIVLGLILASVFGLAAYELVAMPMPDRMPAVMGDSARVCAPNIVLLSLIAAPFVFWAARAFAPTRPMLAGAAAGLLTAALATTLYGLHCPERTASFVAVWYTLGMGIAVAIGALIGRRVFRW